MPLLSKLQIYIHQIHHSPLPPSVDDGTDGISEHRLVPYIARYRKKITKFHITVSGSSATETCILKQLIVAEFTRSSMHQ